jgi:hypothetical protein
MMLSTKEFAAHWGVVPKTVRRWIDDDLVEANQAYSGGPYYIPQTELNRFHPSDARRDPVPMSRFSMPRRVREGRSSNWSSDKKGSRSRRDASLITARTVQPWVGGRSNG